MVTLSALGSGWRPLNASFQNAKFVLVNCGPIVSDFKVHFRRWSMNTSSRRQNRHHQELSGVCIPWKPPASVHASWNFSTGNVETATATRWVFSEVPTSHAKEVSDSTFRAASSIKFETSINKSFEEEEVSWRSLMLSRCLGSPVNTFPPVACSPVIQSLTMRIPQSGKERMRDIISS